MLVRPAAIVALMLAAAACATVPIKLPDGPAQPVPPDEAVAAFRQATAVCRSVNTLTSEIGLSGRIGTQRIRGRVLAGFERQSGSVRLEAPAPFGAPIFILAARSNRATLLLPRGNYVLKDAAVADVIEALTGLRRNAEDLLALLTGCLVADPQLDARGGQRFDSGWLLLPLAHGSDAFVKQERQQWQLLSGRSQVEFVDRPNRLWLVGYSDFAGGFPATVRLSQPPGQAGERTPGGEVMFRLSQLEANGRLDPAAFAIRIPDGAVPMSLEELRQMGPLAERAADARNR